MSCREMDFKSSQDPRASTRFQDQEEKEMEREREKERAEMAVP